MKIAVYFNLPSGGGKRALYEQVKRLVKKHTVDIYTLSTANHEFCDLRPLVHTYEITKYSRPKSFPQSILSIYTKLPGIQKAIARKINTGDYDIVYICGDMFTQAPYILEFLNAPSVYYCQEPKREFYENIPRLGNKWRYLLTLPLRIPLKYIDKKNIHFADVVLVNSLFSKKRIDTIYGIDSRVNYLGIDTSIFYPPKDNDRKSGVVSVGGLNLLKGHDFVIRAIGAISQTIRPRVTILGNGGDEKEYFYQLAQSCGVELTILENATDKELIECYHHAQLFVSAAVSEPFGFALLEAIACGLPAVAVDEGAVREVTKGISTVSLCDRNEQTMKNKIMNILCDQTIQEKARKNSKAIDARYNWERSAKQLEETFVTLCEK